MSYGVHLSRIQLVEQRLSGFMKPSKIPQQEARALWKTRDWVFYAQQYAQAASVLDQHAPDQLLPRLQISGQSVECGLKAYLSTVLPTVPHSHDLLTVGKQAEGIGCLITDMEAVAIFQLSLFFYRDIRTGTKYKASPMNH